MPETWIAEQDDVTFALAPDSRGLLRLDVDMTECVTDHGDPHRAWAHLTAGDARRLAVNLLGWAAVADWQGYTPARSER